MQSRLERLETEVCKVVMTTTIDRKLSTNLLVYQRNLLTVYRYCSGLRKEKIQIQQMIIV